MSYEGFLRENLVKKEKPDFKQIAVQLARTEKDIDTAAITLKVDTTWAVTIAYHAMIRAGRAMMYSMGYLPTAKFTHKTIVEFTKIALGPDYETLVSKFNRLRKRRHDFIYESKNHVTSEEAKAAIETAKEMVREIKRLIKENNPQKGLF